MSSAGNLQEIVPYHVVGNVQEIWYISISRICAGNVTCPVNFLHISCYRKCHFFFLCYGISVTNDNYPVVIDLLKERFGKR